MIATILPGLTLLSALACGLMAGVFFAFSTFIMSALARLTPAQGVAAMQSINITVINPLFMGVFLGMVVLSALIFAIAIARWHDAGMVYVLGGAVIYFVGTFLVTMIFNVPLNDALAAVQPASPEAGRLWHDYLANWTMWNHARTIGALMASAAFAVALM